MCKTLLDPQRRRFIRTVAGGTLVAAVPLSGCSMLASGIPESAIAAWSPDARSEDPRIRVLSWAILAPNPHNRQPWLIELVGENEIVVRIDTTRLLPETDPYGRQILIGTGAMLGLLDIVAQESGYQAQTSWFEEGEFAATLDDRPVARVRLSKRETASKVPLFKHILGRRTVRDAYDLSRAPATEFESDLVQLSTSTNLSASVISRVQQPELCSSIERVVNDAWKIELLNPETMMESMRLLRVGSREIEKHRDGISLTKPFIVFLERAGLFDRSEPPAPDSSVMKSQISDFEELVSATPAFFVLTSSNNSRVTQLEVGKAYVRAHLLATARGMVMHPLSQALQEFPEMNEQYAKAHRLLLPESEGESATVQMLCRVGYLPAGEELPVPSPRRGLEAHFAV